MLLNYHAITLATSFYHLYLLFYLRVNHAILNSLIAVLIADHAITSATVV